MKAEKLTDIKKELTHKTGKELIELTLRLAKYKKDNKELLSYLLYYAEDPMQYAEALKRELEPEFQEFQKHHYYSGKGNDRVTGALEIEPAAPAAKGFKPRHPCKYGNPKHDQYPPLLRAPRPARGNNQLALVIQVTRQP